MFFRAIAWGKTRNSPLPCLENLVVELRRGGFLETGSEKRDATSNANLESVLWGLVGYYRVRQQVINKVM